MGSHPGTIMDMMTIFFMWSWTYLCFLVLHIISKLIFVMLFFLSSMFSAMSSLAL